MKRIGILFYNVFISFIQLKIVNLKSDKIPNDQLKVKDRYLADMPT